MSFMRASQLIMYPAAFLFLLFAPGWTPTRLIGMVVTALLTLMVIFAPRIGGQCSKCDTASDVLYGYRCAKHRKRRR
jgi:hypothetical protein